MGNWGCGGGVWAIGGAMEGCERLGCGGWVWAIGVRWRGVGDWGCGGGVWARTAASRSVLTSSHQKR